MAIVVVSFDVVGTLLAAGPRNDPSHQRVAHKGLQPCPSLSISFTILAEESACD
jgi:hypothetical protein